jgi:transcription antitermination factor NusG
MKVDGYSRCSSSRREHRKHLSSTLLIPSETHGAETDFNQYWYAAQTVARHEKRVFEFLQRRDIEAFLPLYRAAHRWQNRTAHLVDLPLFPCYVFVRINLRERFRVLDLPGVNSFVAFGSGPVPLPDSDVAMLRVSVQALRAEPHPFLNIGDRVRVIAGPMRGVEGILARKKDGLRVVINVVAIMKAIAVEIDGADVQLISSAGKPLPPAGIA